MNPSSNQQARKRDSACKPRVMYFITSMAGGGAEKAVASLLQCHNSEQFELHLLVNRFEGPYSERIPAHVKVTELGVRRLRHALPALIRCLCEIRPDVVVSHMWENNVLTMAANRFLRNSFAAILCEHSAISRKRRIGANLLRRWAYSRADAVIGCSQHMGDEIVTLLQVPVHRVHVIPNAVIDESFYKRLQEPNPHLWMHTREEGERVPVVVGAGRLVPEKRFDLLLHAIARINERQAIRAVIIGEGHLRNELESLRSALGLDHAVDIPGFTKNPLPYMAHADVFVQTSDVEGLPTALIEAVACGTPVVATNTVAGTAEVLDGIEAAALIPCGDVEAIMQAIVMQLQAQAIDNHTKGKRRHAAAECPVAMKRYVSDQVTEQYSKLIMDILAQRGRLDCIQSRFQSRTAPDGRENKREISVRI